MAWEFMDYVDAAGRNVVREWLESLPAGTRKNVKAALDNQLLISKPLERLDRPDFGLLRRECKGLIEVVLYVDRVQHRLLAFYGPGPRRQVTILAGAIERGKRLEPPGICTTALRRRNYLRQGIGKAVPHDFS